MCQTRTLSSRKSVTISYCMNCQMIYIWHNNLLLNFSYEKFILFRNAVAKLDYKDCCFPFPDQEERAIINTPKHYRLRSPLPYYNLARLPV